MICYTEKTTVPGILYPISSRDQLVLKSNCDSTVCSYALSLGCTMSTLSVPSLLADIFQDLETQLASVSEEKVRLGEEIKAAENKLKETEGKHQVNVGASLVW